jgi:hypothetical protein
VSGVAELGLAKALAKGTGREMVWELVSASASASPLAMGRLLAKPMLVA